MANSKLWDTHSVLLSKLKRFDERTAWELVDEHFRGPLEGLAARSGLGQAEAQDAVQETLMTFARLHREGGYDPSKGRLRSWLFGIARNVIANARRQLARKRQDEVAPELEAAASNCDLESAWKEEWERHLLKRCLMRAQREVLPRTYAIFTELVIGGKSPVEVAERFEVSITIVYNAKARVSKRLQELLHELEDE